MAAYFSVGVAHQHFAAIFEIRFIRICAALSAMQPSVPEAAQATLG